MPNLDQRRRKRRGPRSRVPRRAHAPRLALSCTLLLLLVSGCTRIESWISGALGGSHGSQPSAAKSTDVSSDAAGAGKSGKRKRPTTKNTGDAWRDLTFILPDVRGGYRARTPIEGHDVDLGNALSLLSISRAYGNKQDLLIDVELIDVAQNDRMRELFNRTRELQRESDKAVIRRLSVQGQKALVQWSDVTKTARASVLVADRFLVNANVKPADSPAPSIEFIEKLDWAALAKFAAAPPAASRPAVAPIEHAQGAAPETDDDAPKAPDDSLLASQPQ